MSHKHRCRIRSRKIQNAIAEPSDKEVTKRKRIEYSSNPNTATVERKSTDDRTTTPATRVNQWPNDFKVKYNEDLQCDILWCDHCHVRVGTKIQRSVSHIQSIKHKKNKELYALSVTNRDKVTQKYCDNNC